MDQFPPNSKKQTAEPKRVERVTSATAVRRKKGLGKQFKHTFFGGDAKSALQYMILEVVIPSIQDTMIDAFQGGVERLIRGDVRPRRGPTPMSGALGHVNYNRMGPQPTRSPMPNALPRRARARHNFGEIVIPSRQEAEEVLERMYDIISKYDEVTVSDLYELTGLVPSHTDHKWGWDSLQGASVGRLRGGGGYLLDLPEPEPLA